MNDKKLLVETRLFIPDPKMLRESISNPAAPFLVKGIVQMAEVENQNHRIYTKPVLMRESQKYADTFIKESRALGELDHPETPVVNLKNASHLMVELHWDGNNLMGTAKVLDTPSGNILKALFQNGVNLGISSRALGSLNKISESTSVVGEDLELIAFDFVSNPSTPGAFMFPVGKQLHESVQNPVTSKWEPVHKIVRDILTEIG